MYIRLRASIIRNTRNAVFRTHCPHEDQATPPPLSELPTEVMGDVQMRHGVESQGLLEQLAIELQELARVCRTRIRDDKADIQILRMLSELRDEALLREVHREGAELNTKVPCDTASDLIKQCLSPRHQHEIDPGRRDLSCEFDAYSGRGTCDERPRPELLFIKQRFHVSSLLSAQIRQLLRDLLLHRFVSQRADPIFQALYLHHHQVGVISGVCHHSHTLISTEEMRGKFLCILFMATRPELLLEPAHWLGEECCRFLRESAALLAQLGTQAAERTSPTRKPLPVPMNAFHKSKQPLLRRTQHVDLLLKFSKLRQEPLHTGLAKLFLGFEVVVNVAYRNMGGFGDVRQTRFSE